MHLPIWVVVVILLVVAGYAVPYLLLSGTERWTGAFLFWIVFGLVVSLVLVLTVFRWNGAALPPPNDPAVGRRRR